MKKILLSATMVAVFIFYALHQQSENSSQINLIAPAIVTDKSSNSKTPPAQPTDIAVSTAQPTIVSQYKNGEYVGDVTDAYYGNYQVKAIISGGQITDIQFLQYPNDRRTSVEINTQASPMLKQEAIQAQSAAVDIISGATQSSRAFIESLQSALNKAKV